MRNRGSLEASPVAVSRRGKIPEFQPANLQDPLHHFTDPIVGRGSPRGDPDDGRAGREPAAAEERGLSPHRFVADGSGVERASLWPSNLDSHVVHIDDWRPTFVTIHSPDFSFEKDDRGNWSRMIHGMSMENRTGE